jgi:hypothetical protein
MRRKRMAALSIFEDGGVAIGCANPIFPIGSEEVREGLSLVFEVFEIDATTLKRLIGKRELYGFEGYAFAGELISLEPCDQPETVAGAVNKLVLKGVLRIHKLASYNPSAPN